MIKKASLTVGTLGLLWLCFAVWFSIAADYGDGVVSGTYVYVHRGEASTLVLKPDHRFHQELAVSGIVRRANGAWRRVGEGGLAFSKEFLPVPGQELGANGLAYGELHKKFGVFPITLVLDTYDVEWYGKSGTAGDTSLTGTYYGDEDGVPASLTLRPDHTFDQAVSHAGIAKRAIGTWSQNPKGEITFSGAFIKTTGELLEADETASAEDPKGSSLQIEIDRASKSGVPTFRKKLFAW